MPTKENIELLRRYAELRDELNKFVYLRANEHGDRYIEYAFIPGAPHDNTCLSWFNKIQVHAILRNGHNIKDWKVSKLDEIYYLSKFDCGNSENTGEHHCSPGHPCKKCLPIQAKNWTYEEPVKCACWYLRRVNYTNIANSSEIKTEAKVRKELLEESKQEQYNKRNEHSVLKQDSKLNILKYILTFILKYSLAFILGFILSTILFLTLGA